MTTIKLKNGSGAPTAGDLVQGEPALDLTNKRLYTENSGGTVIEVGVNPTSVTTGDITATGTATFAGLTTTADVSFGDNDKAVFGAGSDLQIYHDGSNSHITDAGTGNLILQATDFVLKSGGTGAYIEAASGVTKLYHSNALKLATTSAGIDVTGTVTADGLTVDGDGTLQTSDGAILNIGTTDTSATTGDVIGQVTFSNADASPNKANAEIRGVANDAFGRTNIDFRTGNSGTLNTRALISWDGDISFYEDTGTTAKLFWDASAESLGIGTSSPESLIHLGENHVSAIAIGNPSWHNTEIIRSEFSDSTDKLVFNVPAGTSSGFSADPLVITKAGNVGIGRTPTQKLDVNGAIRVSDGTFGGYFGAGSAFAGGATTDFVLRSDAVLSFASGGPYVRARITSDGNLHVGFSTYASMGVVNTGARWSADGTTNAIARGSNGTILSFYSGNGGAGNISVTANSAAYNTSSDQRLKENIVDAPSASDDIDAIQVRSFDWKADGSHQKYGMVAQELQSVAPEAVSVGETEEDMMGVDYSKLVPMLVKEIQSLRARVAQLEGAN